jgi:hypothetical protein
MEPEKLGESVPEESAKPVKAGGAALAGIVKAPSRTRDAAIEFLRNFTMEP